MASQSLESATKTNGASFTVYDWVVLSIYFLFILGIGFYFSLQAKKRVAKKTEAYMTGGGKIPSWIIGFSIWATTLSSLTYLGVPGLAFSQGWAFAFGQLTIIVLAPFFITKIIPFFRRMKETTAYSYLEARYAKSIRLMASSFFILFHIFRMAIVIYLPTTILIQVIPNINPYLITFLVGAVVVLMTLWGGLKGVLYSDAIQGIILLLGILIILIYSLSATNYNQYSAPKFLKASDFRPTLASASIFFIFASNLIQTTYQYVGSQDVVQRYKAANRIGKIKHSLWINAFLAALTTLLFYGAGNALFSYFASHLQNPEIVSSVSAETLNNPQLLKVSEVVGLAKAPDNLILPYFVITILPAGLSGLIIAAIFAASQSTISSSLSSLVNALMVDFVIPRFPNLSDKKQLVIAKILVVIFGLFGTSLACLLILTQQGQIVQFFQTVLGFFGAPIAAIFLLGMFTKSANHYGAFSGVSVSFAATLPIWVLTQKFFRNSQNELAPLITFNGLYIGIISFFVALLVTFLVSLLTKELVAKKLAKQKNQKPQEALQNLTWATISQAFSDVIKLEQKLEKEERKALKLEKLIKHFQNLDLQLQSKNWYYQKILKIYYRVSIATQQLFLKSKKLKNSEALEALKNQLLISQNSIKIQVEKIDLLEKSL